MQSQTGDAILTQQCNNKNTITLVARICNQSSWSVSWLRINRRVWYEEDKEFYVIDGIDIDAGLILLHNETVHELYISVRIDDTDAYQLV